MSSRLANQKNVISKVICVGKAEKLALDSGRSNKNFSLQIFQTASKTHPSCYCMGTGGYLPWAKSTRR